MGKRKQNSGRAVLRQIAALPYETGADGSVRILLITSRDTGRWVIPKGNRIKGLAGHRAAEQEAFEEAGIRGITRPTPLGRYRYDKRRRSGRSRKATVEVYPLAVTNQLSEWPEQGERELRWFPAAEAAEAVDEPDLRSIIAAFREPRATPGRFGRGLRWLNRAGRKKAGMARWLRALRARRGRFVK